MKRLIIAVILIIIVAGLCTIEYFLNTGESSSASEALIRAQSLLRDGKTDEATETMQKLRENWDSNVESILIFVSHGKPDAICESLAVAESYLKSREFPEFYAECQRAENELKHFSELEIPTFNNIL